VARDRASRPEARPLRLFVALEVSEETKAIVADAVSPWRQRYPKARWVPTENWHVTLKFLGRTWPRLLTWVTETVRDTASAWPAFETRLCGLGAFPSTGRARVIWAGFDDAAGRMAGLAGEVDRALSREFAVETRPFRAHLTVARSEPPVRLPPDFGAAPLTGPAFSVDRIVLYRSHLQRPAPRYEPLETLPLEG